MSDNINVLYYNYLITLCDKMGDYVRVYALFCDVRDGYKFGSTISPDSAKTLVKYYHGDINDLEDSYKRAHADVKKVWASLGEILESEGCCDVPIAKIFYYQLMKTNDVCDFRQKVRDWARAELRKEQNGKASTFYDFGELIDRYQKLIMKRKGKK